MTIYVVVDQPSFGPFFSTKKKAEDYLNERYGERNWKSIREIDGYPDIEAVRIDSKSTRLDR